MLLLLPEEVVKRHIFEVHVSSEARGEHMTKLVEVCWTRSISVNCPRQHVPGGHSFPV